MWEDCTDFERIVPVNKLEVQVLFLKGVSWIVVLTPR